MIEHLQDVHKVNRDGPMAVEEGQVLLESAFGKTRPQIIFNADLFRDLLLRWMILNHISFSQVEQSSFRVLLRYLAACVSEAAPHVSMQKGLAKKKFTNYTCIECNIHRDATCGSKLGDND